jgi:response regulator RpfG family c-di-GMP phosphodiesterase
MQPVVLLVDDDQSIRSALRRVFRKNNFNVIEADGGHAALNLLENEMVDVIVSDQRMPGMTGTELLSKVKESFPHVGRIMLSGQSDFDDLCDAINEASVYRFLSKPWDEKQLINVVNDVVPSNVLASGITAAMGACSRSSGESNNVQHQEESPRHNKAMASIIKEAVLRRQTD